MLACPGKLGSTPPPPITVLSNLGELSGRLHSYTDDMLYILGLVKIVTRVSRTIDAKR